MSRFDTVLVYPAALGNVSQINQAADTLLGSISAACAIKPGAKIVVKPNLLAKHPPQRAVTTHPDVVRAAILALQKRGATDITVADSPGGLYTPAVMRAIYEESGIAAVCRDTDVKLYTDCQSETIRGNGILVKQFEVIRPIAECDLIVNLPKMKTHVMSGMSGAVKNLFGCVAGLCKTEFHMQFPKKEHFAQMLVDLQQTLKPQLHIVDAVLSMEGDGPGSGTPRETNLLLGGQNPYMIDLALAHYMGMNPAQLPVIMAAHKQGLAPAAMPPSALCPLDGAQSTPFPRFVLPRTYEGNINFEQNFPPFLRPLFGSVTRLAAPKPKIERQACIGCGKCSEICPQKIISIQARKAKISYKECIRCFCCHEVCPVKAISIKRNRLFHL